MTDEVFVGNTVICFGRIDIMPSDLQILRDNFSLQNPLHQQEIVHNLHFKTDMKHKIYSSLLHKHPGSRFERQSNIIDESTF